jgi:hypothetical protein
MVEKYLEDIRKLSEEKTIDEIFDIKRWDKCQQN